MARSKNFGAIVTGVVTLGAMIAIGATFMVNASPYVDIAEARHTAGDNLHLLGDIDKSTVRSDVFAGKIAFALKDLKGDTIPVDYSGEPIANMAEANRIVAVGCIHDGVFVSHKLMIKCPSKYKDGQEPSQTGYATTQAGG